MTDVGMKRLTARNKAPHWPDPRLLGGLLTGGGIGGWQVIIYLHAGRSAYYRFYHGSIDIPRSRPDVTIAAACYNPSGYFGELQNEPRNPMTAQVTFR
jgi:hypothetical protein